MTARNIIDIDPQSVMFTHSRIRPFFTGCGRRIEDTLLDITEHRISVEDLPLITVIENDGHYFSLNNRRLYVLKKLRTDGLLPNNSVKVYIKTALEREKRKYTPEHCALEARIMNEHSTTSAEESESTTSSSTTKPSADIEPALDNSVEVATSSKPSSKPPAATKSTAPLTLRTCKIDSSVLRALPDLKKQLTAKGNKRKAVLSQLDEWSMSGMLSEQQREFVDSELGI